MSQDFTYPTQYKIDNISIDGIDIMGLFLGMEIYQNIFIPVITGSITFSDTDGGGFVEENLIEFNEPFEFSVTSAEDERLVFKGHLNGVSKEIGDKGVKIYTVDFTSQEMRSNDQKYINKKLKDTPGNIVTEMLKEIDAKVNVSGNQGQKMEFIAARWKPLHVINHVLKTAATTESKASNKKTGKPTEEKAEGRAGFLCWQVNKNGKNEYRFCSTNEMLNGSYEQHGPFEMKLSQRGEAMETMLKTIVEYNFSSMGDIQTKMRSGAFMSKIVSFDMDTGSYKEFLFDGRKEKNLMTDKQKEIIKEYSRILMKPFTNDKFSKDCSAADVDSGDQSRLSLGQSIARQNTFNDQTGSFTLYPQFKICAGDIIEIKINKVKSPEGKGSAEDRKNSGKYVVKQIGHHFGADGRAYSKITTIRSTIQIDKTSSQKS